MLPTRTDVLIAGAGPVGLTAAVALLARGREVTIVDNLVEGQNTSRASVVYPRTLELLELLHRLEQLGGRVLRPYALTEVAQDPSGVTATFDDGTQVRAGYLVGADGVHSTVREKAGIGFRASPAGASYSLADVHLSGGVPPDEVAVFFAPAGQLVCVPFPDGSFKLVANVDAAPSEPDIEFLQDLVDTRGPQTERPVVEDIIWSSRFLVRHGVAERFHTGRIALAGDAAHHNIPLGGQGMNAGIGDAAALAAALDASLDARLDGRLDAGLDGGLDKGVDAEVHDDGVTPLDAYTQERRAVAEQVVAVTNRLTRLATLDRHVRAMRNTALTLLNPVISRRLARRLSMLVYR